MKTTDFKDLAKVNQILPIMQEYFGKSMNLARIKLMAYMLHALCVVQTVSLHKLASAMPTSVEGLESVRFRGGLFFVTKSFSRFFPEYLTGRGDVPQGGNIRFKASCLQVEIGFQGIDVFLHGPFPFLRQPAGRTCPFPHELLGHRDIACTAQLVQLYTDMAESGIGLLLQVIGMNV